MDCVCPEKKNKGKLKKDLYGMSFKVFNSILGRLHGNFQQYYPFSCVAPKFLAHFSKSKALKHRKLLLNIKYMLRVKYICYYNMNSSLIMPI